MKIFCYKFSFNRNGSWIVFIIRLIYFSLGKVVCLFSAECLEVTNAGCHTWSVGIYHLTTSVTDAGNSVYPIFFRLLSSLRLVLMMKISNFILRFYRLAFYRSFFVNFQECEKDWNRQKLKNLQKISDSWIGKHIPSYQNKKQKFLYMVFT